MADTLYYTYTLKIPKATFVKIHQHRLIDPFGGTNGQTTGKSLPDVIEHQFGGKYGTQFTTKEGIESFFKEFNAMFDKRGIDITHLHPLQYLILFYKEDYEQQSIDNNNFNRLLHYARFIVDFSTNCWSHFEMMTNNPNYVPVYDQYTKEYFFAKAEIASRMDYEELLEYVPSVDNRDDIVRYYRIDIQGKELYMPMDLTFGVTSDIDRTLRDITGGVLKQVEVPVWFREQLIGYTINMMLEEHKSRDTSFYREFMKADFDAEAMKKLYKQYQKRKLSNTVSLVRVGTMVGDYLIDNKIYKTKTDIASFLFDYFSLFKAFTIKKEVPPHIGYDEISKFYIKNGITKETIRNMMKDVGEI